MHEQDDSVPARVMRGIVAGAVAGVVASFAMDRFQAGVTALTAPDGAGGEPSEPATQKAADAVARGVTGRPVAAADKPLAGQAIHYTLGVGLGIAYGIAAEFRPSVTVGGGIAYGTAVAALLDEGAVPAVGLGDAPWRTDLSTNLYAYASHLVFGGASELVRRQVAGTLRA